MFVKVPKVSIIIPTFNRKEYLKECLNSVLTQDYKNLEIIISDDNSTDKTEILVKEYQKKFPFIKYVKNTKYPKGPNGNKNNGLDYAIGEIVGILDDDDFLIEKNAITLMVDKINNGYDVVMCNCVRSDDNTFSGKGIEESREVFYEEMLCGKLHGEFWSLYKREVIGNKRFDTDLYGGEGTLWKQIVKGKKIFYIHKAFRLYRIHRDSVTHLNYVYASKVIKNYERDIEYFGKEMKKKCPCYLATIYKGASYYAKILGEYKKGFKYIFESIKLCPKYKASYVMFLVMFLPKKIIPFLSKVRRFFGKN